MGSSFSFVLLGLVLLSSCGDTRPATSEAGELCSERADFWVTIQQDYLDILDDATGAELDSPTPRVAEASQFAGAALLEFTREAETVGCSVELEAGSFLLCDRIDLLQPHGSAGESVITRLQSECTG